MAPLSLSAAMNGDRRQDPLVVPDTWNFDPVLLGSAGLALAMYSRAFLSLRRRGRPDHAQILNALLFAGGIAAGILALVTPLDALADDTLLSAHMVQHLLVGDVAPLLLLLGIRGPIAFFLVPATLLRPAARLAPVRSLLALLLRPRVSFAVWAGTLAAWHVPQAYDTALGQPLVHQLEHASLFLGGVLLWSQIVDPARRRRLSPGLRAAYAALALVAGMVLTELLLGTRPLYTNYAGALDRPFGLTQTADQTWAALVMMTEQVVTLGSAAALLLWRHVERVEQALRATP